MLHVQNQPTRVDQATGPRARTGQPRRAWLARVGGAGGLVFVASVIAQNLIRADGLPANDAAPAKVVAFYQDHRASTFVLGALFPIGAAGIVAFVTGLLSRLTGVRARAFAVAGGLGAAGIVAGYSMLMASDLTLAGYIHRGGPDPGVVSALWVLHNAVFGVLLVAIAVALVGLAWGAVGAGVLSPRWRGASVVGAAILAVGAGATPAAVDGSPVLFFALAGFLVWVAFVARTGLALLRATEPVS